MKDDQIQDWLALITALIRARLDRKGLLHTVSYSRQALLLEHLRHEKLGGICLAPRCAADHQAAVEQFRRGRPPMLLISPALMTGYDFPYDQARYQIIPKLPRPDTRSALLQARLAAMPGYRDIMTMQTLVQGCGRINRAVDDWGETLIVDWHADWFLARHQELAPAEALAAVMRTRRMPPPMQAP